MIILPELTYDATWEGWEVAADDTCRWLALPMIFNTRLVALPAAASGIWLYGWCYANMPALLASATLFDPDTENEPYGWHKRAGAFVRVAPRPQDCKREGYNTPRCVHGSWLSQGQCTVVDVCASFRTERMK